METNTKTTKSSRLSGSSGGGGLLFGRLLFNFLKFSPSYEAGLHRLRLGVKQKLDSYGRQVMCCAELYGDVNKIDFYKWAAEAGAGICLASNCVEICTKNDLVDASEDDLFICFRGGVNAMNDKELLAFIKNHVPKGASNQIKLTPVVVKNLWRHIYLCYLMFCNPDVELWRLGAEAMLVDRFVGVIDPAGRMMNSSQDHERRHLTLMAIRHQEWAFNTAEHAAINDFPCKSRLGLTQGRFDFTDSQRAMQLFAMGSEEMGNARQEVIRCTGASAKLSVRPTLYHQGLLF